MNREPAIADDIFYRSLRHDMICAYHLAPAPDFVLDEGGRFGRRAAVRLDIERAKARLHIGHLEHLDGGLGDLILQFRLEPGRSDHRVPDAREQAGEGDFGAGRHIRHRRVTRFVQHRQDLELAVEIKRERPRYVAEEDIDALPEHVVVDQCLAAVRHMHHAGAGHVLPAPWLPYTSLPGFAFACAISSLSEFTGSPLRTITRLGTDPKFVIGTNSS